MSALKQFEHLDIDWTMTPEDAVTMYLEWGNNNWRDNHQPVRSKTDYSNYFVVDTWGETPEIRLVRRNSDGYEDLVVMPLPGSLEEEFREEYGGLRGVFEPTHGIKEWLRHQLVN